MAGNSLRGSLRVTAFAAAMLVPVAALAKPVWDLHSSLICRSESMFVCEQPFKPCVPVAGEDIHKVDFAKGNYRILNSDTESKIERRVHLGTIVSGGGVIFLNAGFMVTFSDPELKEDADAPDKINAVFQKAFPGMFIAEVLTCNPD